MTSIGDGFFQIAESKYCASPTCMNKCKKDNSCYYYSTPNALYRREGGDTKNKKRKGQKKSHISGGSTSDIDNLLENIKELQSLEKYLFQQLESVNTNNSSDVNKQKDIIGRINELSDLRENLFKQLKGLYVHLNNISSMERTALTDQLSIAEMAEQQLNQLKSRTEELARIKNNKLKMVQIGQYEFLRYRAHKQVMKTIAFTCLGILAVALIMNYTLLPQRIGIGIIILCLSIGLVILIRQVIDIMSRDNLNYNQYTQPTYDKDAASSGSSEGVLEHDYKFFKNIFTNVEDDVTTTFSSITKDVGGVTNKLQQDVSGTISSVQNEADNISQNDLPKTTKGIENNTESFAVVRPFSSQVNKYASFN